MTASPRIERRDPCSPVLQLGTALSQAQRSGESGWLEIQEGGRIHGVQISGGGVADVVSDRRDINALGLREQMQHLFSLPRPKVIWMPDLTCMQRAPKASAAEVALRGILTRQDVFDPVQLAERIPVTTLRIDEAQLRALHPLGLTEREMDFLRQLRVPTPIPMILWKRGFAPQTAAALLMALNVIGVWRDTWRPGELPRFIPAVRLLRAKALGATPLELLKLNPDASETEQDKAFRRLSFELHPDRLVHYAPREQVMAAQAFKVLSEAYHQIKRSRRQRPVVVADAATPVARVALKKKMPDNWASLLVAARAAVEQGNVERAKAFALKALQHTPPPGAQREIAAILNRAA
ncbi:MAG: J domain-containing protein [Proteobacteria bacterium]|nr:J domain-containing protein [Pseudomonadota bacterium]